MSKQVIIEKVVELSKRGRQVAVVMIDDKGVFKSFSLSMHDLEKAFRQRNIRWVIVTGGADVITWDLKETNGLVNLNEINRLFVNNFQEDTFKTLLNGVDKDVSKLDKEIKKNNSYTDNIMDYAKVNGGSSVVNVYSPIPAVKINSIVLDTKLNFHIITTRWVTYVRTPIGVVRVKQDKKELLNLFLKIYGGDPTTHDLIFSGAW